MDSRSSHLRLGCSALQWLAISALCFVAFEGGLHGEFLFDDHNSILDNGTIRDLSNLGLILDAPPRGGSTTDARPLVNLSLACNFAVSGLDPVGYHIVNLIVHLANSMLVLLLLCQLFRASAAPSYLKRHYHWWAFVAALLWSVHPIQTSVVSYVSQRAESMAAFFYLLVLVMDLALSKTSRWRHLTSLPLILGGFCKETIVTVVVVSAVLQRWQEQWCWGELWRKRRREFILRVFALLPVLLLAMLHGGRSGTAASGEVGEVTAQEYLVAQGYVIPSYLYSAMNPFAVCADYGIYPAFSPKLSTIGLLVLLFIFLWASYSVWHLKGAALPVFCGAVFLAPSSSIIPIVTQIGGEHRMYLPSLAIAIYASIGISSMNFRERLGFTPIRKASCIVSVAACTIVLMACSRLATTAFVSQHRFWERVVDRAPKNLRARQNLAVLTWRATASDDAFEWFNPLLSDERQGCAAALEAADLALQLKDGAKANYYLDLSLQRNPGGVKAKLISARLAMLNESPRVAAELCERIVDEYPSQADAWNVLGLCYRELTKSAKMKEDDIRVIDDKAEFAIAKALELVPWSGDARYTLAGLYLDQQRDAEAEYQLRQSLIYAPRRAETWYWLAYLDEQNGNLRRAISEVEESLRLDVTANAEFLRRQLRSKEKSPNSIRMENATHQK